MTAPTETVELPTVEGLMELVTQYGHARECRGAGKPHSSLAEARRRVRDYAERLSRSPVVGAVGGEPTGWQPIETAPKDRAFLAWVDGAARVVRWGNTSHITVYGFCLADQGPEDFDLCEFLYWTPLPAAPGGIGVFPTGSPEGEVK